MRKVTSSFAGRAAKNGLSPSRFPSVLGSTWPASLRALRSGFDKAPRQIPSPAAQATHQGRLLRPAPTSTVNNLGLASAPSYDSLPKWLAARRVFSSGSTASGTDATDEGKSLLDVNHITVKHIGEEVADLDLGLDLNENQEGGNAALPSTDTITQLDEELRKLDEEKKKLSSKEDFFIEDSFVAVEKLASQDQNEKQGEVTLQPTGVLSVEAELKKLDDKETKFDEEKRELDQREMEYEKKLALATTNSDKIFYQGRLVKLDDEKSDLSKRRANLEEQRTAILKKSLASTPETNVAHMRKQRIDIASLLNPLEVDCLPAEPPQTQFCAPSNWIEDCCREIMFHLDTSDGLNERVTPIALVRCSRGGKSRASREIHGLMRRLNPDVSFIFVSFNDYSPVKEWERSDPIAALCCRIAYAIRKNPGIPDIKEFSSFRETWSATEDDIITWLGNHKCVLLIDELNVFLGGMDDSSTITFVEFLKIHFLSKKGRYFAFSSHLLTTNEKLSSFLDSNSERGVIVKELPLVPTPQDAREKLSIPDLTVAEITFAGRVPALIYHMRRVGLFEKRDTIIDNFTPNWTDDTVKNIFRSFFSGKISQIPEVMHQLMNPISNRRVAWIPLHMVEVLDSIADAPHVSNSLQIVAKTVFDLFHTYRSSKPKSGDSWESLFVIAAILRVAVGEHHSLLGEGASFFENSNWTFSYNEHFSTEAKNLAHIGTTQELEAGLESPPFVPHIAMYYPRHAQFEKYDFFIVYYNAKTERSIHGYQFKEGSGTPDTLADCSLVKSSFVIRGSAAQTRNEKTANLWTYASTSEIDEFLGISGRVLAPSAWRRLHEYVDNKI